MNVVGVADTHAALWYLEDDLRLSAKARGLFAWAAVSGQKVGVASISLAEVIYLVEKRRVSVQAYEKLRDALSEPLHVLTEIVLDSKVTDALRLVSRDEVPDMPDRIVAATGLMLGVPVISRDGKIRASSVTTIW